MPTTAPAVYRVAIPGWRPALLNEYVGRHWSVGARLKKRDRKFVGDACWYGGVLAATCRRRVTLTIVLGPRQRQCDPDAPWKSLLDALKTAGALVDDSPDWCEVAPLVIERGARLETVIELTDID